MDKTLIFIALDKTTKERYEKDLKYFFGKSVNIKAYSLKEGIDGVITGDLALISSDIITGMSRKYLHESVETIHLRRTFLRENVNKLWELPKGLKAMVVSNTSSSCLACISSLYDIGMHHLDLYPYYPNIDLVPDVDMAITPAKVDYVPDNIKNVIDIGWRVIDISTLMDVRAKLKIKDNHFEEKLVNYTKGIIPISYGLQHSFTSGRIIKDGLNIILNSITDGVILTDLEFKVIDCNKSISTIFSLDEYIANDFKDISEVISTDIKDLIFGDKDFEDELIQIKDSHKQFLITKKKISSLSNNYNILYIIKDITELENLEKRLRKELVKKGYFAKYTFENIIGESPAIKKTVAIAKKMGSIGATTLITGKSGTGKELFAQSIHNISDRKLNPFVAINCASLPSSLLESELFGYEEGSFTGAKKGGKKGLFELAHTGTIFLDEIGDMPLDVQAKLLRVLQEKEVMRVGSSSITPIDVMVIAATNHSLRLHMEQGKFRRDLYYRLNILNLNIPPLSERTQDIPSLINHILESIGRSEKKLDDEVKHVLLEHKWEGNIRELRNCIEYMAYLGGEILSVEDLPIDVLHEMDKPYIKHTKDYFPEFMEEEKQLIGFILQTLKHRSCGRRFLFNLAKEKGYNATEHDVRKHMEYLLGKGYITYEKKKKGASIAEKGLNAIE